jgi:uncharacterized membrane protein (UPF0127 family)
MALVGACGPTAVPLQMGTGTLTVEVADDDGERQLGLMYRDSLGADAGMVFVYPDEAIRRFWMKDTRIPLSIAFLDSAGVVVHVADMRPLTEQTTSSMLPARYAVEANVGWFAAHDVKPGTQIRGLPSRAAP